MSTIIHISIDQQYTVAVDKACMEPKLKKFFFLIFTLVKFNLNIIINNNLIFWIELSNFIFWFFWNLISIFFCFFTIENWYKVSMRLINNKLRMLMLCTIIKKSVFAVDFIGWNPAAFVNIWSCNCSDFVQLHHNSWHFKIHFSKPYHFIFILLLHLLLLYFIP